MVPPLHQYLQPDDEITLAFNILNNPQELALRDGHGLRMNIQRAKTYLALLEASLATVVQSEQVKEELRIYLVEDMSSATSHSTLDEEDIQSLGDATAVTEGAFHAFTIEELCELSGDQGLEVYRDGEMISRREIIANLGQLDVQPTETSDIEPTKIDGLVEEMAQKEQNKGEKEKYHQMHAHRVVALCKQRGISVYAKGKKMVKAQMIKKLRDNDRAVARAARGDAGGSK